VAKIALLVGISKYDKQKSGLEPLPSTLKDVEAMRQVLEHPEQGGFAEVQVLTNPTKTELEIAVYELFVDRNPEDLVLFYFSGHGVKDQSGNLYLTTPETRQAQRGGVIPPTAVAASYLQHQMSDSRSEYQVIILDCCFSGAIAKGLTAKGSGDVDLQAELGGRGRAILTSSSSVQSSFQQGESQLSIYTQYLVEGIGTGAADRDSDGRISADELHRYASEKVKEAAPAMTPQFYPVREGYNIYLAKAPQNDPKLEYRKEVEEIAREEEDEIGLINRRCLERLRQDLGLSVEEADTIENEVLEPFRQRHQKLQAYEEALIEAMEKHQTLRARDRKALKRLQGYLGLTDEDVEAIITKVIFPELEKEPVSESGIVLFPDGGSSAKSLSNSEISSELDKVELKSEKGADYTPLRELLKAQKWKEADGETARIMLEVAGRTQEGWLNSESIEEFPCADLRTLDQLWVKSSGGRFGFSVQKRIYHEENKNWERFGDRVGWRVHDKWLYYEGLTLNLSAPEGHLPWWGVGWLGGSVGSVRRSCRADLFSRVETCKV
jgi:uncharacterized caspase-like protein